MHNRAVITGLGAVSAFGLTTQDFWQGLSAGSCAVRPLSFEDGLKMSKGYILDDYDPEQHFATDELALLDRFSQYAILASKSAVADSGLTTEELATAAVVIGSGNGGKHTDEEGYSRLYKLGKPRVHPYMIPKGMHSAVASNVSLYNTARGPTFSVSSACASGAHAIIQAAMMVQTGLVDTAIAGGSDAPFSYGILKAWDALRVVSNDALRPFSADRSGMILGDGAGVVTIESEQHARARGADIYATLEGYGMTSDAGHITNPDLDGIIGAMMNAHENAGIPVSEIDYINAHGTGTPVNDRVETQAIRQVYGEHNPDVIVSSTKAMHGHALGASSALELIATIQSMQNGRVLPQVNYTEKDPECDLNLPVDGAYDKEIDVAVSNSFAFGGLNASIILSRGA